MVAQHGVEGNNRGMKGVQVCALHSPVTRPRIGRAAALALSWVICGCAAHDPAPCLTPAENRMTLVTLYFGSSLPGGGTLSDMQWAGFVGSVLGASFPDGFTVYDGSGQWRDKAGHIGREPSKIVQIAVVSTDSGLAGRVGKVSAAYRAMFHQEAVGVVTQQVCGAF